MTIISSDLYLSRCDLTLSNDALILRAPDEMTAIALLRLGYTVASWARSFKKQCVQIYGPDNPNPFHVSAMLEEESMQDNIPPLEIPGISVDMNQIYANPNPAYITSLVNLEVLFANPAALAANQHSLREFRGQSATALNYPEELDRRRSILLNQENLNEYEYRALRWFKDPETGLFRRKEMDFVSNFSYIGQFFGEPCYTGRVLFAEETGTIL